MAYSTITLELLLWLLSCGTIYAGLGWGVSVTEILKLLAKISGFGVGLFSLCL